MASDEAIQLTNNDASSFKSYAVSKGYWRDAYINLFSPVSNLNQQIAFEHKPPEMSRGYFARVNAMRTVVHKFLAMCNQNCQIVNLGAGYDTLYFNLFDQNKLPVKYVEIDFQRIVTSKIRLIKSKKALAEKFHLNPNAADSTTSGQFKLPTSTIFSSLNSSAQQTDLITDNYCLISVDLRNLDELEKKLNQCKLDRDLPTLFIAECVLVSLEAHSTLYVKNLNSSNRFIWLLIIQVRY